MDRDSISLSRQHITTFLLLKSGSSSVCDSELGWWNGKYAKFDFKLEKQSELSQIAMQI
jgi:hypothetical protein